MSGRRIGNDHNRCRWQLRFPRPGGGRLLCGHRCPEYDLTTTLLLPGGWTLPQSGEALATITVEAGEAVNGVNFGWDYEFLPLAEVDQTTCTRSIGFEEDLTVPDDTVFALAKNL